MFYMTTVSGKSVLKSDLIETEHFFTTRNCIIKSNEPGNQEQVPLNKNNICKYLNIDKDRLISPVQTHSSNIQIAYPGKSDYPDTDCLVVKDSDLAVFLNFADCTPIILYDYSKNIGAVCHAGWRGTALGIASKTVKFLQKEFNCNPRNIAAVIGPAICFECYDVGEDVRTKLSLTVSDFSGLSEVRDGRIYVDLKGINARQLAECGVNKIDIAPFCTCCNNDLFFSYRKENGTTNRHSALLKINKCMH